MLEVVVSGPADLSTITTYVIANQTAWRETNRTLWDLRAFDMSRITSQDILNIDQFIDEMLALRTDVRAAFLVSEEVERIARIAAVLHDSLKARFDSEVFVSESAARDWLMRT
ncbi:MAG: hypothetical protein AB7I04_10975 [Pseudomonadales bacterium]